MPNGYVIPPAGNTAVSFFTPTPFVDPAKPPAMLARQRSAKTGAITSLFVGVHPVDAAIVEQFRIKRGSGAAVLNDGQEFYKIDKVDEFAEQRIRFEVQRVLQPFVDRGDIEITTLLAAADQNTDYGAAFVEYRNLHTSEVKKAYIR